MNIVKRNANWDPFDLITDLQTDLNRVFTRSLSDNLNQSVSPRIELKEEKDHYIVKADLPGLDKNDFEVTVKENHLILHGERKSEVQKEEKGFTYSEVSYGSFSRTLPLPGEVKTEAIEATYKNGVLQVTLPKSEKAKPKQITVNVK